MHKPLILGGTTEASALAQACAEAGIAAVLSYAGRVEKPRKQPIEIRVGGFGGATGLTDYLRTGAFTALVDATHPFAATMSRNAIEAAAATGVPLVALERAPWLPQAGDHWHRVADIASAAAALDGPPQRVFLAIGRQGLFHFAAAPQHHYLLRLVDPPEAPLPLPNAEAIIARGPFSTADDHALLVEHQITCIVAKNAGGEGARAKLEAARMLGLPVIMIARPAIGPRKTVHSPDEVMAWLGHVARLGV